MKIKYKINENDFLTHQLFVASKSEEIKKKRQRSKVTIPLLLIVLGGLFLLLGKVMPIILFFIFGLLWFFIYPLWEGRKFVKHHEEFIRENYKGRLGRNITLEITNDYFWARDKGANSKFKTAEIKEIYEIPTAIYVNLKGGDSVILPKDTIGQFDALRKRLKELAGYLKISYITDENWKWK